MSPSYYFPVFILSVAALCTLTSIRFATSPDFTLQEKGNKDVIIPFLLCLIYAVFLGNRPPSGYHFGDTIHYITQYNLLKIDSVTNYLTVDWTQEWLWQWIMYICKDLDFTYTQFLTAIDIGYFFTALIAVYIFMPKNLLLGLLFVLSSLMFYSFGVNGIRNGLACHLLLLGFALWFSDQKAIGSILIAASFGIHRSVILPIMSCIAALYFIKDVKIAVYIWIGAIVASFFAGDLFINFFANLGFDDRMSQYATDEYSTLVSRKFRWDFLLYSSMPVLFSWYTCVKRGISENWYKTLCITYILANSFWVLVIRAAYSNRFAYLSWFIYPIVIAYPIIMLPVWEDQDFKTAAILMSYVGFTIVMNIIWHQF